MQRNITVPSLPTAGDTQVDRLSSDLLHAYDIIRRAEQFAIQQEQKDDMISAGVVGYLLLELNARSEILGEQPCASIVKEVTSQVSGKKERDVVFEVGRHYRNKLLRACTFDYFPHVARYS